MSPKQASVFLKRKKAVEMYMAYSYSIQEIKDVSGIDFNSLRRFIRRCLDTDPNGYIWGYRGLLQYKHINTYERKASTSDSDKKLTGAFQKLINSYPKLEDTIRKFYFRKEKQTTQEPIMRIKHLHKRFIDACRVCGLTERDYPFNTMNLAKRSLERYVKKLEQEHFSEAAEKRYGKESGNLARSTGIGEVNYPDIVRPYERVQFDGHRIDVILAIVFHTPEGDEIVEIMDRVWLLSVIDVATRTILGYHLSLNKEYSASDVLQCIRNAIVPIPPKELTIPGLCYRKEGGFVSSVIPEAEWGLWNEFLFDNGKANLAKIVQDRLTQVVGCAVNAGAVDMPMRRGIVERFFKTLEENGFHRLPSTTGSSPSDPRRQNPEKKAIQYRISVEQLEELTAVLISDYNGTPHEGINNLSPLEVMRQRVSRGLQPRVMPEEKRSDVQFLTMKAQRKVKGSIESGRRPSVWFEGVSYRNEVLSRSPDLIGTTLDLLINIDDLRVIQAFLPDGSEFGVLIAMGKWGITPHNLQIRKQINKLRSQNILFFTIADDPIECFQRHLESEAKNVRSSRNKLAQLKRKKVELQPSKNEESIEQECNDNKIVLTPREISDLSTTSKTTSRAFRTITY